MSESVEIQNLKRIRDQRASLKKDYRYWMQKAADAGLSSSKVARCLGLSETAVRLYRKRNGISGD